MSIIRTRKNKNYTTINNTVLNDAVLTWKAKGLAVYLLSKPDDWKVQREHLAKQSQDGISAVRSALQELEKFGYLVRQRTRNERGIIEWEYVLYEEPQNRQPLQERTETRKKKSAYPSAENQPMVPSADFQPMVPSADKPPVAYPPVDKPPVDKPPVDKRTLLNTNIVSTEEVSTEKGARMESVDVPTPPTPAQPATPKISLLPNDGYEIPIPPTNGHTKRYTKVTKDYYDPRRLVDGYIPAGQGITAIEVYHEWVAPSARRLSQPNQADITQQATDLERWRQAVKAWVQSGHRPENVKGLLDWYHDPSRIPGNKPTNGATKTQPEVTFKQWLLNTYHSTFAATIKPESELRDEYRQWRKANGLPPAG